MSRTLASTHGSADQVAIAAGIRRAHELRAQFLADLFARMAKAITSRGRNSGPKRQLESLPDHQLKDIGLRRDQLPGLVNAALRRDELSLSPTGNTSAPAFLIGAPRRGECANENIKSPKAA